MLQFAIIGCGRIAGRHAAQIDRVGKLVAVCDVDASKADALAAKYGARAYTRLEDLLQAEGDVDVVAVCTPNGLHAEHAIKSLQAGKHVLCEKPMCLTAAAAYSMRDTAHFFRRKLFVVKQNRFNPPVLAVKRMLEQNALGKIISFSINGFWNRSQDYYCGDWRGTKELDGGILYTQFSHFIDLMLWLLGNVQTSKVLRKNSGIRNHFEIEDTVTAVLEMKSGTIGTLHFSVNSYEHNKEGSLSIIGSEGTVKIGGQYLNTLEWNNTAQGIVFNDSTIQTANDYGFYKGSMSNHNLVYDELAKAIRNEKHDLPNIAEAMNTVTTIEKMYEVSEWIN